MTDVIRPANGQTAGAQSARNACQVPQSTAGYDGAIGERNLMAPESGEASAWPNRPGAASPAGWFLLADGEAAPLFGTVWSQPARMTHPRRRARMTMTRMTTTRDGAWYTDPAADLTATGKRALAMVIPEWVAAHPRGWPDPGIARGRAGGPGMAVPQGAVPGLLDPQQRSGWQLAQQVWQESGVVWELARVPSLLNSELANPEPANPELALLRTCRPCACGFGIRRRMVRRRRACRDSEPVDSEPVDSEPVDSEFVDPEPASTESAGTWFDGPGPADPRLAARRSAGDRPTVVEFTGPYFADSGVIPMEPEFPSTAIPRQPTFTPADNSRLEPGSGPGSGSG